MLKFAPIMPAFCLLLLYSYYANNFAGEIDGSLLGGLEQYVHGVAQATKQYTHKIITAWIQVYIRMYTVNDKS